MKRFALMRKYGLFLAFTLVLAVMVGTAVVYAAVVNIDTFVDPGDTAGEFCGGFASGPHLHTASAAIGGFRKVAAECVSGSSTVSISVDGAAGTIGFSQGTGARGMGTIWWDGDNTDAGTIAYNLSANLSDSGDNTGLYFIVTENDNAGMPIHFTLFTDAANFTSYTFVTTGGVPPGSEVGYFLPFADFTPTGSLNLTNVGAIEIEFDGVNGALPATDISLSLVQASPSVFDYGTLPNSFENGDPARHQVVAGPRLGPDVFATAGKSNEIIDPEPGDDGVSFIPGVGGATTHGGWTNGTVASGNGGGLALDIQGADGIPQVFIDFGSGLTGVTLRNADGTTMGMPLTVGSHNVYFDIPLGTFDGTNNSQLPVRVRISSAGGLSATGFAPDGEVEDYEYGFGPTAVALVGLGASQSSLAPVYALAAFLLVISLLALAAVRRRPNPSV